LTNLIGFFLSNERIVVVVASSMTIQIVYITDGSLSCFSFGSDRSSAACLVPGLKASRCTVGSTASGKPMVEFCTYLGLGPPKNHTQEK
jgi:hypothetical protein